MLLQTQQQPDRTSFLHSSMSRSPIDRLAEWPAVWEGKALEDVLNNERLPPYRVETVLWSRHDDALAEFFSIVFSCTRTLSLLQVQISLHCYAMR